MATTDRVHPDVLLLIDHPDTLAAWRSARDRIRLSGHPTNDGEDDDAAAKAAAAEAAAKKAAEDAASAKAAEDEEKGLDWRAMARKHEREAKKARAERDAHAAKLAEVDKANLSDNEKAIAKAREEARTEARGEAEKERRVDRLELAVTRLAVGKGVKVGDGDNAKTVKFSDAEDVQMWLERRIARGDLDAADVFGSDGRVDTAALTEALVELANQKPGWLVGAGTGGHAAGDADAGKGASQKSLEAMTHDDHLKAIQRR